MEELVLRQMTNAEFAGSQAQAPDGEMLGMVCIGFDRPDPRSGARAVA